MIGGHPGGRELTERLLSLGGLLPFPGAKALDLGAGEGISAEYLRRLGFWTAAIDREPENGSTAQGDMRELPFPGKLLISAWRSAVFPAAGMERRHLGKPGGC